MRLTRERLDHANASKCFLHRHYHFTHAFILILHRLSRAAAIDAERQQTGWKKNQCHHRESPIHQEEDSDSTNNGDWLFKKITADAGQSHLHGARVVGNAGHQKPRTHLIKKIHRMPNHLAKKLPANIGDDLVAHPLHIVGVPK